MISASTSLPTPVSPTISTLMLETRGALRQQVHPPHLGTAADVVGRRRRRRRCAPAPARRRARSARRRSARRPERRRRRCARRRRRQPSGATMRAPNSATRLASCSNRIISYSSGPYDASTSPGRTCGETISPTVSGDVPGATCSRMHREHPPRRRRLVALLLQPAFEIGVRRQPAHAHRRPAPLDHQRRPPDRDRLAGQHRRALPGLQQVRRAGACRWCCPGPRSPAPARRAAARGGARRSRRRCARRRSRRARSTPRPASGSGCIEKMFAPITIRCRTPSSTGRSSSFAHRRCAGRRRERRFVGRGHGSVLAVISVAA